MTYSNILLKDTYKAVEIKKQIARKQIIQQVDPATRVNNGLLHRTHYGNPQR